MFKTLQERIDEALTAGFTASQLARAADVSPGAVSQWKSGGVKTLRGTSAAGLAALTGWNVTWWAEGKGLRDGGPRQAHPVSQDSVTIDLQDGSPRVEWGSMKHAALPETFRTEVPDDAMADRVKKGHVVRFTRSQQPRPGDGVLVEDSTGAWFFRLYSPGAQGRFSAVALNPAYQTLDSERDGLKVLAVLVGVPEARWG